LEAFQNNIYLAGYNMTESSIPKNCIVDKNSNCKECDLDNSLLCNFDKKFAKKFLLGNTAYRIIAITILILAGFITGQLWMFIIYTIMIILTFFIIELRLLCSHCPFYAMEGRFLKCWALRGMPKLWKYRPEPMSKSEKNIMLIIGMFIDLFPFVGSVIGIILFVVNPTENIIMGAGLIIATIIFIAVVIYFSLVLQGYACKKCPNFSCPMNKTPDKVKDAFMEKNELIKKAWQD